MTFTTLAVIMFVSLAGPLVALPARRGLPVVLGELLAGLALGPTALDAIHASDSTFTFLADIGFALVMFVAGSHVPVRSANLRPALLAGFLQACLVGVVATILGVAIASLFHTGHVALYIVLLASSSAAVVLPVTQAANLADNPLVLRALAQVAVADTVCIVALPLALDPRHAGRAALGALAVIAGATVLYLLLRAYDLSALQSRLHELSKTRQFALELRLNLTLLFALASLAIHTHVSVMLAGFAFGLAVARVGEPRRLAKQLFAITEGFLAPLFFVWLGASINLGDLRDHPSYIALGVMLGLGATLAHLVIRLAGQPIGLAALAAAQLGVPMAAATVGTQLGILRPGESPALILGALITVALASIAAASLPREVAQPM